jgi:NAD(P)H-dependent flavin oxidoreductase YrpB (nitropropane dioxygenase family)
VIKTALTELLGTQYPIIQGGMGYTKNLTAAVSNAGALGLVGAATWAFQSQNVEGWMGSGRSVLDEEGTSYEQFKRAFHQLAESTRTTKGIFGLNLMLASEMANWTGQAIKGAKEVRDEDPDIKDRFRVIVTSAGNPLIWADAIKSIGIKWFHVVPSVKHAKKAEEAGVDLIVASGHEAGMHIAWEPVHSLVLLPAVVQAVNVPVVGAGGFCDGATLAAALALGAHGIQMGTRFIATRESDFTQMHKDYIVNLSERETTVARAIVGPGRYLKTEGSMEPRLSVAKSPGPYLGEPDNLKEVPRELVAKEVDGGAALIEEDEHRAIMPAGEVAGRISDIPTVKELIESIMADAEEIVRNLTDKFIRE